jgi:hypothetical protein
MFEHLSSHEIQLTLCSVGQEMMCTIVQKDDAISGVTWLSLTDFGMQILKRLTVMDCSHYITF